ncbi:MAG TPA: Rieske (2Fe-2S) protein [Bacillales bacterium]|nr:Rieske (2Fe-2S) protein [Bacillales bacterium]
MAEMIHAGSIDTLRGQGAKVVKGGKHGIAVLYHEDEVYAVDNRCPHMGFPLHQGSLCDGILTCHWHHARFDVKSGGTLDPWADDATTYPVEVKEGEVWIHPEPYKKRTKERLRERLREGLEQNLNLVIAKGVVGLIEAGEPAEAIAQIGVEYGTKHRESGWRSGLTILTAMTNVLPKLDQTGQILALYQGLVHVAQESDGMGTRFLLGALPVSGQSAEPSIERLADWYRHNVEGRDSQGAERTLLTAIELGATTEQLADMMMKGVTDHFYINGGHALDFHNKAFEVLEKVGEEHRPFVLTSLLPAFGNPSRSEELNSWQSPVNLVKPLNDAFEKLPGILESASGEAKDYDEEKLVEQLLSDRPVETVHALLEALKTGVKPVRLAQLVALAASERIVRFHMQNEFSDWITVLHTFTHAHAVHEALRRSETPELMRAVFHGAMSIYLDRFLNIPSAKRPKVSDGTSSPQDPQELLDLLDQQKQVDEAAGWVMTYLGRGGDKKVLFNTLGHALLREDAEFHSFQLYEGGIAEHDHWAQENSAFARKAQETMILAMTRYLAGHAPTDRELPHTARIAMRLQRGERLFEEE